MLERPPQTLDENIILDPVMAIHTDSNVVGFQQSGKAWADKGSLDTVRQ